MGVGTADSACVGTADGAGVGTADGASVCSYSIVYMWLSEFLDPTEIQRKRWKQ